MKKIILFMLLLLSVTILVSRVIRGVILKQELTGHIERAATTSDVDTAIKELIIVTDYLEQNDMTTGKTSVLWSTPDEDITYWYNNLVKAREELINTDTSNSLVVSNALLKLKQTLTEGNHNKSIVPAGLALYPYNLIWGILCWMSIFILLGIYIYYNVKYAHLLSLFLLVFALSITSCSKDEVQSRIVAEQCDCVNEISFYSINNDGTFTLTDYTEAPITTSCSSNNTTIVENIQLTPITTIRKVTKTVCN